MVIKHAEKLDCRRFLAPQDIIDGSPNLNLAFVAQFFKHRLAPYSSGILICTSSFKKVMICLSNDLSFRFLDLLERVFQTEHLEGCCNDSTDATLLAQEWVVHRCQNRVLCRDDDGRCTNIQGREMLPFVDK